MTPPASAGEQTVEAGAQKPEEQGEAGPHSRIDSIAPQGSQLNQTLTEIQLADRQFDIDRFLGGARAAYQMIVEAYAAGDKSALKPLLSQEVFGSFSQAIDERAAAGQSMEYELVGIKEAQITGAKFENKRAEVTVSFEAEIVRAIKSAGDELISGDPTTVVTVIDVWTFARDVKSKSPDWLLIDTDSAE